MTNGNEEYPDYGLEGLGYAPWQLLQALFPYLSMGPNLALQMSLAQFGEQGAMGRQFLGEQGATGRAYLGEQGKLQQIAASRRSSHRFRASRTASNWLRCRALVG